MLFVFWGMNRANRAESYGSCRPNRQINVVRLFDAMKAILRVT